MNSQTTPMSTVLFHTVNGLQMRQEWGTEIKFLTYSLRQKIITSTRWIPRILWSSK